jgi:hypothetical protein
MLYAREAVAAGQDYLPAPRHEDRAAEVATLGSRPYILVHLRGPTLCSAWGLTKKKGGAQERGLD